MTEEHPSKPRPKAIERAAKAIYTAAVDSAREKVAGKTLPIEKITAVFEDAFSASDREAAIIIFALIDDIVSEFFCERLTGKIPHGIEQAFFEGNGMLASAHSKILLLAGLEWIRIDIYKELSLIRRIRNQFAHHVEHKRFSDSPILRSMGRNCLPAFFQDRRLSAAG
jgi:hypothetical protein